MATPHDTDGFRRRIIAAVSAYVVQLIGIAAVLYASPLYWKQDYHTSALTGEAWVNELKYGHPDRIWTELGVRLHVFIAFVAELETRCGLTDSKGIKLDEQAAIFLYACVTGLSVRHIGERFQRSNDTIAKYFKKILVAVSTPPFYTAHVYLPSINDPIPAFIQNNSKFFPFFSGALGAMDGTHINCCPSAADRHAARNRKGGVTQNCLACCSFAFRFLYIISGWEGSAADATLYANARLTDFVIPDGKYYLADAGFGICDSLLVPYRGVRYHLAEWGRANIRPANKEELYNLRHAQARNVIERIFGVLKSRWAILTRPPHYDMAIQARVLPGLAAMHNFIMEHDLADIEEYLAEEPDIADPQPGTHGDLGVLAEGYVEREERERATANRDVIAQEMWYQYQQYLHEHPEVLEEG